MTTGTVLVSEETYRRIALRDPDGRWELHVGLLREKPGMSFVHNRLAFRLAFGLQRQLESNDSLVGQNGGRVCRSEPHVYIPDVFIAPAVDAESLRSRSDQLEIYDAPLPLVVEVWSASTEAYDVNGSFGNTSDGATRRSGVFTQLTAR